MFLFSLDEKVHLQLTKILNTSSSSYLHKLYPSLKRFLFLYDGTFVMFGCGQSVLGNANAFSNRHLIHFFSLQTKKTNRAISARMYSIATHIEAILQW